MQCGTCGNKLTPLFTSQVCDFCEKHPPVIAWVVGTGAEFDSPIGSDMFKYEKDAQEFLEELQDDIDFQDKQLKLFRVATKPPVEWIEEAGVEVSEYLFTIYPHKPTTYPNKRFAWICPVSN